MVPSSLPPPPPPPPPPTNQVVSYFSARLEMTGPGPYSSAITQASRICQMDTSRGLVVLACEVSSFSLHSCLHLWPVVGVASGGEGVGGVEMYGRRKCAWGGIVRKRGL